ncbi:hypothetical protein AX15_006762 [Amanita polypyramis BW_CC]|nr:hypothetical protein AX15_006762 [Amanita polypyramis BW_CC]
MILPGEKLVIVGAGCFGVSTAYHLLKRGFTNISIIERSEVLPAKDAASNDMNKIVRSSYADSFYAELGREAIRAWKNRKEWGDTYHESGLINVCSSTEESGRTYIDESYRNDVSLGARVKELTGPDAIRGVFPETVRMASFGNQKGYINYDSGWADAGQGLSLMIRKVKALGGHFITGKSFSGLIREGGRTVGVSCADGSTYEAALVILSLGSWTASALPDLGLEGKCLATGQCLAMVQLTAGEAAAYRDCPVLLDLATGFYILPPTKEHVVKLATHKFGYTNYVTIDGHTTEISTPRTVMTDPVRGLCIPKGDIQLLRSYLRQVYPDLAEKPFIGTRLCWYNDSPDGDWIIGRYPGDDGVMLATGGSGHAYKFLPVIGQLVADAVQDRLDSELVKKFAVDRTRGSTDRSRSGTVLELHLDELCTAKDLSVVNP